jgi:hypothetical protein
MAFELTLRVRMGDNVQLPREGDIPDVEEFIRYKLDAEDVEVLEVEEV